MKKITVFIMTAAMMLSLAACTADKNDKSAGQENSGADKAGTLVSEENNPPASKEASAMNSKVLIAYFSVPENVSTTDAVSGASIVVKDGERMGNTEYVAKLIQQTVGGDLFRIETVQSYPLDHEPLVDYAADEKSDGKRPELSSHVENFEQYETVILGFPNWWADLPMPVYTFLEEYDFGAKTIIPFVTHGGSGFSNTLRTISELQPGAHVSENTLSLSRNSVGNSEEQVAEWAKSLGLY